MGKQSAKKCICIKGELFMIVPRYYEDLSVLHENTMPARAYYIPVSYTHLTFFCTLFSHSKPCSLLLCLRFFVLLYIAYPNLQNMSMNWIRQNMH